MWFDDAEGLIGDAVADLLRVEGGGVRWMWVS
jgi:hypothetical protein